MTEGAPPPPQCAEFIDFARYATCKVLLISGLSLIVFMSGLAIVGVGDNAMDICCDVFPAYEGLCPKLKLPVSIITAFDL